VEGQFDRPGHIGDVGEVAALAVVAIDDDRLASLDLATERFQGEIAALAGNADGEDSQCEEA
jgi:hypothetical protein